METLPINHVQAAVMTLTYIKREVIGERDGNWMFAMSLTGPIADLNRLTGVSELLFNKEGEEYAGFKDGVDQETIERTEDVATNYIHDTIIENVPNMNPDTSQDTLTYCLLTIQASMENTLELMTAVNTLALMLNDQGYVNLNLG